MNIRIITIANDDLQFKSSEPCCGTHANNTKELEDFCITNVKHTGRNGYLFTAVTNRRAIDVKHYIIYLMFKHKEFFFFRHIFMAKYYLMIFRNCKMILTQSWKIKKMNWKLLHKNINQC